MKKRIWFPLLVLLVCSVFLQSSVMGDVPAGVAPLETVRLRSPGINAIVYGGRPTLKWFPVDDATVYDVILRNSHMVVLGEWQKGVGSCEIEPLYCIYRIPFDLEDNYGTYNWSIRARNTDTGAEGQWAVFRNFTYTQLDRTWQISPVADYVTSDHTPELQWANITGATKYLMQFRLPDDSFVFNVVVDDATYCDDTTCTWSVDPTLLDHGDYKWHVRAKNGRNFGRWTAYRNITIADNPQMFFFNDPTLSPKWLDPFNHWALTGGSFYTGETSSVCDNNCATTIFDENFTDAKFTVRINSIGVDANDGYWLYFRSTFDSSGTWLNGYRIRFNRNSSDSSGIRLFVQSKLNGDTFPSIVQDVGLLPLGDLDDWHTIEVDVNGNTVNVYVDYTLRYTYTSISSTASSGKFAVDVMGTGDHVVNLDQAHFDDATIPDH